MTYVIDLLLRSAAPRRRVARILRAAQVAEEAERAAARRRLIDAARDA
jgi:hypothetical protein